ncbi:10954_t:CDS:2, partial [Racocetra persica]
AVTTSREEELLQKLAELEMQLRKSIYDFDVVVAPKRTKSSKWPANIESTTIEEFKKIYLRHIQNTYSGKPSSGIKIPDLKFTVFIETPSKPFNELSEDPNPDIDMYPIFSCGSVDLKCKKLQDVVKYLMAELEL